MTSSGFGFLVTSTVMLSPGSTQTGRQPALKKTESSFKHLVILWKQTSCGDLHLNLRWFMTPAQLLPASHTRAYCRKPNRTKHCDLKMSDRCYFSSVWNVKVFVSLVFVSSLSPSVFPQDGVFVRKDSQRWAAEWRRVMWHKNPNNYEKRRMCSHTITWKYLSGLFLKANKLTLKNELEKLIRHEFCLKVFVSFTHDTEHLMSPVK